MSAGEAAIRLRHVSVTRGGVPILNDVNWQVERGQLVAILGPNGSGKTTLTRVITGYEWPTHGSVEVLGEKLGATDVRRLRRRVQMVNPSHRFGVEGRLPAVEAVITGYTASLALYEIPTDDQRQHAARLLRAVGLDHRIEHPFGLLSTGEQRRCLLARALVTVPEILILDEPTAGLDVSAREHLLATIAQLRRRPQAPAIILVTHHVEEIGPGTSQVLMLRDGRVAAAGPPERTITPERLSELFGCRVFVQKRSGRYWLEVLPEAWLDLIRPPEQG